MRLRDLADIDSDSEVTGFAIDHRKVAPGSIFGAFKGQLFNGEEFIGQAVERGAVAVVAPPGAQVERVPHLADAERWPVRRHICRVSSTVDVLPLVPVTATTVSG